ncbi:MAG: glycoside hydrolase family 31 protein [Candidatus Dormibacteraeota bacterium]|nr:glycoside hydrolase family 31 protein [Candidatus Dormibacteraeota bacterium]
MDTARLVTRLALPARPATDFLPRDPVAIRRVRGVRSRTAGIRVDAEDDRGGLVPIDIKVVSDRVLRLHFGPGAQRPSRLITAAPSTVPFTVNEDGRGWSIATAGAVLSIDRDPYRLRLTDAAGMERFVEEPNDRDIRGNFHHPPSGSSRGLRWITGRLREDEALFGLGEHFGSLNRRGQAFSSWTVDAFGVRSDRAYKNCPLLLSTHGFGLFFDMTAALYYELGQASVAAWQVTARADHLRVYLILGDDPAAMIAEYHALTGAPAVPPAWSFGLWMSRWGYRNRDEVLAVAHRLRAEQVPCDVIHIDPYWMRYHEGHHGDLTWDEAAFPDPAGMIGELKAMGFKLSLWESPYVPLDSAMFAEGLSKGYLLKTAQGGAALVHGFAKPSAAVDFTNPAAVDWFKAKNRSLLQSGVAVMKTDFAEDMPADAVAHDGTPATDLHNLYPLLYQRAVFEVTQEVHGYGLVWGRSGYAGSQRYPVQWGGDPGCSFEDMAASLRGALSWILSGMAFSSFDMGGFFGIPTPTDPPSPELYVRWSQMGLLFSHARAHGHTAPREPWAYGEPALTIFRRYAELRYQLLPYLYSAARKVSNGPPLARPLVYDYPRDRTTHQVDDEYLLGPDLLVAPMFKPRGTRDVYLPAGDWYDYWTDDRLAGGRWVEYAAELDRLPLFVRAGAVLPMGPPLLYSDQQAWEPLVFHVYPGPAGTHAVELEDDRGRRAYRLTVRPGEVRLDGEPPGDTVLVHLSGHQPVGGRLGASISLPSA